MVPFPAGGSLAAVAAPAAFGAPGAAASGGRLLEGLSATATPVGGVDAEQGAGGLTDGSGERVAAPVEIPRDPCELPGEVSGHGRGLRCGHGGAARRVRRAAARSRQAAG
jgi:hypothetical protein